jgi:hypothetical protein
MRPDRLHPPPPVPAHQLRSKPSFRLTATTGVGGLAALALGLLGLRLHLEGAHVHSLGQALSWLVPVGVLSALVLMAGRGRGAACATHAGIAREADALAGLLGNAGQRERLQAGMRHFRENQGEVESPLGLGEQPPLAREFLLSFTRSLVTGVPLRVDGFLSAVAEQHSATLLPLAQGAVALGLLGSLSGLVLQALSLGSGAVSTAFGDDLAVALLVALSTTIEGFAVAVFIAALERGVARRGLQQLADPLADLHVRLTGALGAPDSGQAEIDLAIERLRKELTGTIGELRETLPGVVQEGFRAGTQDLAHELQTALGGLVGEPVRELTQSAQGLTEGLRTAEATLESTATGLSTAVGALRRTWDTPEQMAAILTAARDEIALLVEQFEQIRGQVGTSTECLTTVTRELSVAAGAFGTAGVPQAASLVRETLEQVEALSSQLEEMLSALGRLARRSFEDGAVRRSQRRPGQEVD